MALGFVAVVRLLYYENQCVGAAQEGVDQEEQEVLLVVKANAVVDPGTVMIHTGNAPTARGAVMALRYFDRRTLPALARKDVNNMSNLKTCQFIVIINFGHRLTSYFT